MREGEACVMVCPCCHYLMSTHSDFQARECYESFLRKLELVGAERFAPVGQLRREHVEMRREALKRDSVE